MKTDTFPRSAFRVSTDALRRVVIEPVTVHSVDKLRGVAACSLAVPGYTLRNDVPFAELARDGRRAARLAARLVLDPAGLRADRSASAVARVRTSLSRSTGTGPGVGRQTVDIGAGRSAALPVAGPVAA